MRFIIIILCLLASISWAQNTLEENVKLLCLADDKGNEQIITNKVKEVIQSVEKFKNAPPKKAVKKIYSSIKKNYLSNYYESAFFGEIFTKNRYNCVTGTALFALIFEEFNIPYSIVEIPRHIYLVAYPNAEKIGVESTAEKRGIYPWTETTKSQALYFLLEIERINKADIEIQGADNILEKHFYTRGELDIEQLSGIQLFNKAIVLHEQGQSQEALATIDEAKELYQSEQINMIVASILSGIISETEYKDVNLVQYMCRYYNLIDSPARKDHLKSFYKTIFYEALHTRDDTAYIDESKIIIESTIEAEEERNEILSIVYRIECLWLAVNDDFNEALDRALTGYVLNKEDASYPEIIVKLFGEVLDEIWEYQDLDDFFENLLESHPVVLEEDFMFDIYFSSYLYMSGDAFYHGEVKDAWNLKSKVDKYLSDPELDAELFGEPIGYLYGNMASYYYRQKDFDMAKEYINLALEYDPESMTLQRRKSYIDASH